MMKAFFLFILFLVPFLPLSADEMPRSWKSLLENTLTNEAPDSLIQTQQEAYVLKEAPTIAEPVIKNIPITECGEVLVDVNEMNHTRIQMLPTDPQGRAFASPDYHSGLPNASKMRLSVWKKLEQMLAHLDVLSENFGYKPGQVSIKVFEGLRDLQTQQKLYQTKVEEILSQNPDLSEEEAEAEASKWVSPVKNNVPVHSTGAAVDIRLWDEEKGEFLDLGSFGVIWGANKTAPTFSEEISNTQKTNRLYLLLAAARAGLVNYVYEYWHFSSGDRYAAYWLESDADKRIAKFGAISE